MKILVIFRAMLLMVLPTNICRLVTNRIGTRIEPGCNIGFSWITADRLEMAAGSRIGHFNRLIGPVEIVLARGGAIGNFNWIVRSRYMRGRPAMLSIGVNAKITSRHRLDLTESIIIGNNSIIAGAGSQLWTHGYIHEIEDAGRYRIDGSIVVEDDVYIGSMVLISMGVRIGKGVIVGGGAAVGKDLLEPGLYVSAPLRCLPRPANPDDRTNLEPVDCPLSGDRVYRKKNV